MTTSCDSVHETKFMAACNAIIADFNPDSSTLLRNGPYVFTYKPVLHGKRYRLHVNLTTNTLTVYDDTERILGKINIFKPSSWQVGALRAVRKVMAHKHMSVEWYTAAIDALQDPECVVEDVNSNSSLRMFNVSSEALHRAGCNWFVLYYDVLTPTYIAKIDGIDPTRFVYYTFLFAEHIGYALKQHGVTLEV